MNAHRFVSMGCDVVVGGASEVERRAIELLFADRERMFSRFRPDSELNRVNQASGSVVKMSAPFAEMLELALRAAKKTDGLVDPTLGAAIEAAGYDRDFSALTPSAAPAEPGARGRWRYVRLRRTLLHRPRGVLLDLNGVVKGKTVDDALALIDGDGFVSAGGDLAARGGVDVALPDGGAVRVLEGGLATSSTAKRRWLRAGVWQHHLIDPRTGRPCETPWQEVTVSAATCLQADVAAKAALLLGDARPALSRAQWTRGTVPPERWRRGRRRVGGMNAVEWYSARAGGIVAYVLLTAVVLVGLAMSSRARIDGWPRFALEDVHRFLGALTGLFISLHVFTLAIDAEANLPLGSLIVPFAAAYRPFWTGIGIVAAELLLALAIANHYRDRIAYRTWRRAALPELRGLDRRDRARPRRGHRHRRVPVRRRLRRRDRVRRRAYSEQGHPRRRTAEDGDRRPPESPGLIETSPFEPWPGSDPGHGRCGRFRSAESVTIVPSPTARARRAHRNRAVLHPIVQAGHGRGLEVISKWGRNRWSDVERGRYDYFSCWSWSASGR